MYDLNYVDANIVKEMCPLPKIICNNVAISSLGCITYLRGTTWKLS